MGPCSSTLAERGSRQQRLRSLSLVEHRANLLPSTVGKGMSVVDRAGRGLDWLPNGDDHLAGQDRESPRRHQEKRIFDGDRHERCPGSKSQVNSSSFEFPKLSGTGPRSFRKQHDRTPPANRGRRLDDAFAGAARVSSIEEDHIGGPHRPAKERESSPFLFRNEPEVALQMCEQQPDVQVARVVRDEYVGIVGKLARISNLHLDASGPKDEPGPFSTDLEGNPAVRLERPNQNGQQAADDGTEQDSDCADETSRHSTESHVTTIPFCA